MSEICWMTARELAARVRTRDLSPVEIIDVCLEHIEAVNPALNAFCFVFPEEALDAAHKAEAAIIAGNAVGPLHGVPVAIKD